MRPLLVYDGDCAFCAQAARWAEERVPAEVEVTPWQQLDLEVVHLERRDVLRSAWFIDRWGHRHGGHRAVARALISIGGMWRVPGWALLVPPISWLAAPIYRLIARYRHRMPGATEACEVPRRPLPN